MDNILLKAALAAAAIALTACSSQPATTASKTDDTAAKEAPAGPPEPVSARTAYWKLYDSAHAWASDLTTLSVTCGTVSSIKNTEGRCGVWTIIFASPTQRTMRRYIYAVADQAPDILKGVKAGLAEAWGGPTKDVMAFQAKDFTIDSDAAMKVAEVKADKWLKDKDNAEKPVAITLGAAERFTTPVWAITFGSTKSGFLVLVNASTGDILTK
jgi:hypothetical protein